MASAKLGIENPSLFLQVEKFMEGKQEKKLGNNTVMIRDQSNGITVFHVKLHASIIASYSPHQVELTLAGYNTVTTRGRLNKLAPVGRFFQKNHDPFFSANGQEFALNSDDFVRIPWSGDAIVIADTFGTMKEHWR